MAQQAILAAQRRRNQAAESPGARSDSPTVHVASSLLHSLQQQKDRVYQLFAIWDEDGNGTIDEHE